MNITKYADVVVSCQNDSKDLPNFLAPCAFLTQKRLAKELELRVVPKIRYRKYTAQKETSDIVALIQELDTKYGLSQKDS